MAMLSKLSSQTSSECRSAHDNRKRRRRQDATRDNLILVMRGFSAVHSPSSEECPAGIHCPFARGPGCSSDATKHSDSGAGCPIGAACISKDWQYSPPPTKTFDIRFENEFVAIHNSDCFEVVHGPRGQDLIDFEPCSNVTLHGDPHFVCYFSLFCTICTLTFAVTHVLPLTHPCCTQADYWSRVITAVSCAQLCCRKCQHAAISTGFEHADTWCTLSSCFMRCLLHPSSPSCPSSSLVCQSS